MPFKHHDDSSNPLTGWSGKRSMRQGKDALSTAADPADKKARHQDGPKVP